MDPKSVEQIRQAMFAAMRELDVEYITLMRRMGVKQLIMYRF